MPSIHLGLVALGLIAFYIAVVSADQPLIENSGFHCKSKYSMRLDRRLHGMPRHGPPPFELLVLDEEGQQTEYYEPGKIYTVRLIGYIYYRGLMMQARLCDDHGFVIGALRGGRFLETPDWVHYGIRIQECDLRYPTEDSVTHADDSRKFVTQVQWTTNRNIDNVQFMLTIATENDVYWERYRPRSGFLQPMTNRDKPNQILRQVFFNEKNALKYLAGRLTSGDSKLAMAEELTKQEEVMPTKPTMAPEALEVLSKMEPPEFWTNYHGKPKIINFEENIDIDSEKIDKTIEEVAVIVSTVMPQVNDSELSTTMIPQKENNPVKIVETSQSEAVVEKKINDGELNIETNIEEVAVDRLTKSEEAEEEVIEATNVWNLKALSTLKGDKEPSDVEAMTSEADEITTRAETATTAEAEVKRPFAAAATTNESLDNPEAMIISNNAIEETFEGSADEDAIIGKLMESEVPVFNETITEEFLQELKVAHTDAVLNITESANEIDESIFSESATDTFENIDSPSKSSDLPKVTPSDLLVHI